MRSLDTSPDRANPFADTAEDPQEMRRQIALALKRARLRGPAPAPRMNWEDPGLHGSGRQVDLRRGRVPASQLKRSSLAGASGKLPPLPRARVTAGQTVAIIGGVIVIGGLLAWMWHRKRTGAELVALVGDDSDGFDYLGAE